jgi:hypothetical protein
MNESQSGANIQYVHIRARNNGIPVDTGGFTLAVKARSDGKYSVAIAQCPSDKICAKSLGKKMASKKLSEGKYMVKELPELQELADKLAEKICTGNVKLRIDISHIVPRNNP